MAADPENYRVPPTTPTRPSKLVILMLVVVAGGFIAIASMA